MLVAVAGALTLTSAVAHASERVHARLTYGPDPDVERCPTERDLRDAVAARLGYDPFDGTLDAPDEGREVVVLVHKRGAGIVGALELKGPRPGQRELASPRGDCREVLDSFAVAIAIGLDPASLTRPPGEPPQPPPPSPPSFVPPSTPPVDSAPPAAEHPVAVAKDPVDVRIGGGPVALFGELPSATGALAVSLGLRWRWLEPSLEGLASLPVTASLGAGKVSASLLTLGVVPCGRVDLVFGCVGISLGSLRGEAEGVPGPLQGSSFYASVSARAGVELALTRSIWLRGYAEGVAPLTHVTLQLASQDVWTVPSVAARVGASAGIRF